MATNAETRVGVIGLGNMGMGVARSLLRAGFSVTGYDPRENVLAELSEHGGYAAAHPAGVGTRSEIVVVLVVNAAQTKDVLFGCNGVVGNMPAGSIVITSSTVPPVFAEELGRCLEMNGLLHIDAPVSGGAARARAGKLSIMASGPNAAFERCENLFAAISEKLYRIGDRAGQGSTVKMINQLLAGIHIAAASEAMALGIKSGADPQVLFDVVKNSAGSSWMFENRVPHILAGDYAPLSAVNIFVKDLGIVLDCGRAESFPLPLTATAHQMFLMAAAAGLGGEDDSAVVKIFPGLVLPETQKADS